MLAAQKSAGKDFATALSRADAPVIPDQEKPGPTVVVLAVEHASSRAASFRVVLGGVGGGDNRVGDCNRDATSTSSRSPAA